MSNPGKALFSLLVLLTILTYIVFRSDVTVVDIQKEKYNSAIQTASQTAVLKLIDASDINSTYDGVHAEASDLPINFDSLDEFRSTLSRSLESKKSTDLGGVSNINIPLVGFVTYDYIVGVTYGEAFKDINTFETLGLTYEDYEIMSEAERAEIDKQLNSLRGNYLLPSGYTYYVQPHVSLDESITGRTWRFTLGDAIYIPNKTSSEAYNTEKGTIDETKYIGQADRLYKTDSRGRIIEGEYIDLGGYLTSIGFSTTKQFSNYIVMASINDYLNSYSGVGFNATSKNTGTALEFNLGKQNYSENKAEYNKNSSVIEGPGLFAVIDLYKGSGGNTRLYERMASFGGSELVRTNINKSKS